MSTAAGLLLFRHSLFELDNARTMSPEQIVQTFIPIQSFWRLLSAKHHVLVGSRGSGKTVIAKMLSHDHLSRLQEPRAQNAIESRAFVGMYVPTKLKWVSALKNKPWQNEEQKERFFQWRLNIATCLALLASVRSCLESYLPDRGDRARAERDLCVSLSYAWAQKGVVCETVLELLRHLEDLEYAKQQSLSIARTGLVVDHHGSQIAPSFDQELFEPLQRGITLSGRVLPLASDAAWLLCLDETEHLQRFHLQIINAHMRAHSGNLFFKITTTPYKYTAESTSSVSLDAGHDFDYVFLDADPVLQERVEGEYGRIGTRFARRLFEKRAHASGRRYSGIDLKRLLGSSELLDPCREDWSPGSENMSLLKTYCSAETVERAQTRPNQASFDSEIGRKLHGALLLRHKLASLKGKRKLDAYSGATMIMRCGDGNPRRIVKLFNEILLGADWISSNRWRQPRPLSRVRQTEILTRFSYHLLASVQSEPHFQPGVANPGKAQYGPDLYDFITSLGEYFKSRFVDVPLTTDQVASVEVDHRVTDEEWTLVQFAVSLGLIYPQVNPSNPDDLPVRSGTYHLAYALAPRFRIMPRRGKARALSRIRSWWRSRLADASRENGFLFPGYQE